MTIIISNTNCGNSPKQAFLEAFNIAFAKADIKFLLEHVTSDITWIIIGDKRIEGIENFASELERMKSRKNERITHR
ncbi:nuclear transport factor 2-like protein [Portibacter lacus]|uniref:Uncharacterized protein n=1 Tax=Portibacter lacus TaxID=1099794 RepID=A0AA37SQA4_9BACT|nr:hypothetical protein [Portibacter lacus]GLR16866.1 hypothetical protein GCM10007940_14810 [Portibacter lacus]